MKLYPFYPKIHYDTVTKSPMRFSFKTSATLDLTTVEIVLTVPTAVTGQTGTVYAIVKEYDTNGLSYIEMQATVTLTNSLKTLTITSPSLHAFKTNTYYDVAITTDARGFTKPTTNSYITSILIRKDATTNYAYT